MPPGPFLTELPVGSRLLFLLGAAGILLGLVGIEATADPGWIKFFDNLHWTFGTAAAAGLAWLGWRQARRAGRSGPEGWFTAGFVGYALGQLIWDIQSWFAYTQFPAPSDLFYIWLGPCLVLGLMQQVRASLERVEKNALLLDTLSLSVASLTLVLALYLPERGALDGVSLSVLVAYPVALLMATLFLLILIPAMRLGPTPSLILFLPAIAVTAWSWMRWNLLALQGVAIDGDWRNVSFSLAILAAGLGAASWRLEPSDSPRWDRLCEGFLRLLPLITVILASGAIIAANFHPGVPEVVRTLTHFGAFAVIVLAVFRQGMLLNERDKLLAAQEALRERESQLRQERGFLKSLLQTIPDLVWMKDPNGVYLTCNPRFEQLYGASEEKIVGRTDYDFVERELADFFRENDERAAKAGQPCLNEEWLTFAKGGYRGLFSTMKTPMYDGNGQLLGVLGVARDITELKQHEDALKRLAHYDSLTGIPNRRMLVDRMRQAIGQARRDGRLLAICYLDLDGFKPVNDTLGHEAGDRMLIEIAERIARTIRSGDTVARLGGDEFVVLLVGLDAPEECSASLDRLLEAINRPVQLHGSTFSLGASIGVTLFPWDDEDPDTLLRHADQTMYVAKQSSKNQYRFYDPAHDQRTRAWHESIKRIAQALHDGEFELYFQPRIDLGSGRPFGVEALPFWHHPEEGLVGRRAFLPPIEGSELEVELGAWLFDRLLAQTAAWQAEGLELEIGFRVSHRHLQSRRFLPELEQRLAASPRIDASRLLLSIGEESIHDAHSQEIVRTASKLGVRFALERFGAGCASFTGLRTLPIEAIKIDRALVNELPADAASRTIVQGLLALAGVFGLRTIAGGIRDQAQIATLLELGCTLGQGEGIAAPVKAAEFAQWYRERTEGTGN